MNNQRFSIAIGVLIFSLVAFSKEAHVSTAGSVIVKSKTFEISSGIIRRSTNHAEEATLIQSFKDQAKPVLEAMKISLESRLNELSKSGFQLVPLENTKQELSVSSENEVEETELSDTPTLVALSYSGEPLPDGAFPSHQTITITIGVQRPPKKSDALKLRSTIARIINQEKKYLAI